MSLPAAWVDRIFEKLTLAYGRDFLGRWEGVELNAVKSDWAHELSGFDKHPEAIAWALQNLPERPPTVLDFRKIARLAPSKPVPQLEYSPAGKERIAAELAKLGPGARLKPARIMGNKDWAHAVIARAESGGRVTRTVLKMARDALAPKAFVAEEAA